MHVVESPSGLTHPFKAGTPMLDKAHREQALRMLSALVASEDQDDLDLRIVTKSGDIKDEIVATIAEQQTDMMVIGTHGRGFFARLLIGSITEAMLRRVSIPVLTVCRTMRPLAFRRILFATDLSDASKSRFPFVLEMAQRMDSEVILVHALDTVSVTYGGAEMASYVSEYDTERAKAKLAEFLAEATVRKIKVESFVVEGVPAEAILKAANQNEADLVLITVAHKGIIERALLGTTAERVIREANVPVLSIPAAAAHK